MLFRGSPRLTSVVKYSQRFDTVRFRTLARGLLSIFEYAAKMPTRGLLYVLQTLNMIPFRMRTYTVVEALLKTRHFISFGIRTYRKSLNNAFAMNTYKKPRGVGVPPSFCSLPSEQNLLPRLSRFVKDSFTDSRSRPVNGPRNLDRIGFL